MSSPDIIYTQEFRVANGTRYLQYTERKEAINPSPEDIEIGNKNFNKIQTYQKTLKVILDIPIVKLPQKWKMILMKN